MWGDLGQFGAWALIGIVLTIAVVRWDHLDNERNDNGEMMGPAAICCSVILWPIWLPILAVCYGGWRFGRWVRRVAGVPEDFPDDDA